MPTALEEALARVDSLTETERRVSERRRYFLKQVTKRGLKKKPRKKKEGLLDRLIPNEDITRAGGQIASALANTPAGIYEMGKAGVLDTKDLVTQGDVTPERLGGIGEAMARGVAQDFRHPRENLGYLLMDLASLASGGAGLATRVSRAGKVYKAARRGEMPPETARKPLPPPKPSDGGKVQQAQPKVAEYELTKTGTKDFKPGSPKWLEQAKRGYGKGTVHPVPKGKKGYGVGDVVWSSADVEPGIFYNVVAERGAGGKIQYRLKLTKDKIGHDAKGEAYNTPQRAILEGGYVSEKHAHEIHLAKQRKRKPEQAPVQRSLDDLTDPESVQRIHEFVVENKGFKVSGAMERFGISHEEAVAIGQKLYEGKYVNEHGRPTKKWSELVGITPKGKTAKAAEPLNLSGGVASVRHGAAPDETVLRRAPETFRDPNDARRLLRDDIGEEIGPTLKDADIPPWAFEDYEPPAAAAAAAAGKAAGRPQAAPDALAEALDRLDQAAAQKPARGAKKAADEDPFDSMSPEELAALEKEAQGHLTADLTDLTAELKKTPKKGSPVKAYVDTSKKQTKPKKAIDEAMERLDAEETRMVERGQIPAPRKPRKLQSAEVTITHPDGTELWRGTIKGVDEASISAKAASMEKRLIKEHEGTQRAIPRKKGTSPRAKGTNDRARGINKDLLQKSSVPDAAIPALQKTLRQTFKDANNVPTQKAIRAAFQEHLGEAAGKTAFNRWVKADRLRKRKLAEGGSSTEAMGAAGSVSNPSAMRAALREFAKQPRGGSINIGFALRKKAGERKLIQVAPDASLLKAKTKKVEIVPIEVALSNSPLIAAVQKHRYKWMSKEANSAIGKMYKTAIGASQEATRRHVEYQLRELNRLTDAIAKAEGQLATLHQPQKLTEQIKEAWRFNKMREAYRERRTHQMKASERTRQAKLGRGVDTANQLAIIATLYLKPAYLTANLIGQAFFVAADHYMNPLRVNRAAKLRQEFFKANPELRNLVREAMGQGIAESIEVRGGSFGRLGASVGAIHGGMTRISNKVLDDWWRETAFFNEAMRHGYTTPGRGKALVTAQDNRGHFIEVSKRANRNMVDYGRMSATEKNVMRRIIFFYPWVKGSSLYTLRFATEHPGQALAYGQGAREAQKRNEKILGPVPSYAEGLIPVGSRTVDGKKMPRVINPVAAGVFGSLGDVIDVARGNLSGQVRKGDQITQFLSPSVTIPLSVALRRDLFTGAEFPATTSALDIAKQETKQLVAPLQTLEDIGKARQYKSGERDPSEVLFPYTPGERALRYLGGTTPFTYNPKEGRSRAFAETRALADKQKRVRMKYADERKELYENAMRVGLLKKGQKLPAALTKALAVRAERDVNIEAFKEEKGGELTTAERLYADLSLIVRQGRMPEKRAQQILERIALMPDPTVEYVARKIRESYFSVPIISRYKAAINGRLTRMGERAI